MKKHFWTALFFVASFVLISMYAFGYGSSQGNYGTIGTGSGTTINNNYFLTNNSPLGPVFAFGVSATNPPITSPGGTTSLTPFGATVPVGYPVPQGTYTNPACAVYGLASAGTNVIFCWWTNGIFAFSITQTGNGTNFDTTHGFTLGTNCTIAVTASNNTQNTLAPAYIAASICMAVPTSTASVATTNTVVNVYAAITPNTYYISNTPAAVPAPNNPLTPYAPIFCDGTGTNFPNSGQAVDLASNGSVIVLEAGSYLITNIFTHDNLRFKGANQNWANTRLYPTNNPNYLNQESTFSFFQPGNNNIIENLNLDGSQFTNQPGSGNAYGSWFLATPGPVYTNLLVQNCNIYGAWDTLYTGNQLGSPSNHFTAVFKNNVFQSKWDLASLALCAYLTFEHNTFYDGAGLPAHGAAVRFQGGSFGSTILIDNKWLNFTNPGDNVSGSIQVSGDIYQNHGANLPWQFTNSPTSSGNFYDADALRTWSIAPDEPLWAISGTNFTVVTNFNNGTLYITASGGDAGSTGKYSITNTLAWTTNSTAIYIAQWTNGATGTAARTVVMNDPVATNLAGFTPTLSIESNGVVWGVVSLSEPNGADGKSLWDLANTWGSINDPTYVVYPATNSFTTNGTTLYNPSLFNGAVVSNGISLAFSQPVTPSSTIGLGTIINTNWVLGGKYSFPYPILVSANAILTTAGVAGNCDLDLEVSGNTTNRIAVSTIITSIASSYTNYIGAFIPANTTFDFTNRSNGAGDSAAVYGGQYIIQ